METVLPREIGAPLGHPGRSLRCPRPPRTLRSRRARPDISRPDSASAPIFHVALHAARVCRFLRFLRERESLPRGRRGPRVHSRYLRAAARARRPGGAGPRRPGPGALSLTNPIRGRLAAFFAAFAPKCISPHARGRSTALLLLQRERSCYGKFIPVPTTNWLVSQSQRG